MRLNRVLLLAASINMAMLATVFTISCSGDDGKQGPAGAECTVDRDDAAGITLVTCGGVTKEIKDGGKGDTGPGGGDYSVGGCSVSPNEFNKYELAITCGSGTSKESYYFCSGVEFDKTENFCHNGIERFWDLNFVNANTFIDFIDGTSGSGIATGKNYNVNMATVPGVGNDASTVLGKAGKLFPLPSCGNAVSKYDPNIEFCLFYDDAATPATAILDSLCGGEDYEASKFFCQKYTGARAAKWGSKKVEPKCTNFETYAETKFCRLSGGTDISQYTGDNGSMEDLCGGTDKYGLEELGNNYKDEWGSDYMYGYVLVDKSDYSSKDVSGDDDYVNIPSQTFCSNGRVQMDCRTGDNSGLSTPANPFFIDTEFCQNPAARQKKPLCAADGERSALSDYRYMYDDGGMEGSYVCDGGTIKVQCSNGVPGSPIVSGEQTEASNTASFYETGKEFCRFAGARADRASAKKKEVAPLCKTSSSTIINSIGMAPAGNDYDDVEYFCNQPDFEIAKRCPATSTGAFYDENKKFCYLRTDGTHKITDFCANAKGEVTSKRIFDEDERYCSFQNPNFVGEELTGTGALSGVNLPEVFDMPFCMVSGSKIKINANSWLGEYCVGNSIATTGKYDPNNLDGPYEGSTSWNRLFCDKLQMPSAMGQCQPFECDSLKLERADDADGSIFDINGNLGLFENGQCRVITDYCGGASYEIEIDVGGGSKATVTRCGANPNECNTATGANCDADECKAIVDFEYISSQCKACTGGKTSTSTESTCDCPTGTDMISNVCYDSTTGKNSDGACAPNYVDKSGTCEHNGNGGANNCAYPKIDNGTSCDP